MERLLTAAEKKLILALIKKADFELPPEWLDQAKVSPMDDGGMGSLRFLSPSTSLVQKMGKKIAEVRFRDADGVDVIASMNLDKNGIPFELDIWKVNFKPLIRIPGHFAVDEGEGN